MSNNEGDIDCPPMHDYHHERCPSCVFFIYTLKDFRGRIPVVILSLQSDKDKRGLSLQIRIEFNVRHGTIGCGTFNTTTSHSGMIELLHLQ